MKFNKVEQIELTTEEVRALDIVRRLGEHISGGAEDEEHRAKGEAIYQACAALEFVHNITAEDPDEVIFRRKDLWHASEGDWSIDDLRNKLPIELSALIERALDDAKEEGRLDGYNEGYDDGYYDGGDR